MAEGDLRFGPLDEGCAHLCVDMQRMFSEATPWQVKWLPGVLPRICQIAALHPERTFFTRFITAPRAGMGWGAWKRYYKRWASMTIERLGTEMLDLAPELRVFAPPAEIIDKPVYSPWMSTDLHARLQARGVNTLVITGGETEVCVLAAVMGAIDLGYRVVLAKDAVCSSADETHDAMVDIYCERFQMQVEAVNTDAILEAWKPV
jgi:nicotinamidase-related amidase